MNFITSLENASLEYYIINKWILFHMFFSHLITRHWYVCRGIFTNFGTGEQKNIWII